MDLTTNKDYQTTRRAVETALEPRHLARPERTDYLPQPWWEEPIRMD
jgi:hypothetical protein